MAKIIGEKIVAAKIKRGKDKQADQRAGWNQLSLNLQII